MVAGLGSNHNSQAPGQELLEQLELITSEVGKALKLSAKSMTDNK